MKGIKDRVLSNMPKEEKVELQAERIELGALQDLRKFSNIVFDAVEKQQKTLGSYVDLKNELRDQYRDIDSAGKTLDKNLDNLTKAAKELGLSVSSLEEYNLAKDAIKAAGKAMMEIEKATK